MTLRIEAHNHLRGGDYRRRCDNCGWEADFAYPIQITLDGRDHSINFCLACVEREMREPDKANFDKWIEDVIILDRIGKMEPVE